MLTNRTYPKHMTGWQPGAAMYGGVCAIGLSLSSTNSFHGRIGQETSLDRRNLKI